MLSLSTNAVRVRATSRDVTMLGQVLTTLNRLVVEASALTSS